MAKNTIKMRKHDTGRQITTKTPYGTTSEMVVNDSDLIEKMNIPSGCVLIQDDQGYYITKLNRIDNGLADPNRYDAKWKETVTAKVAEVTNV